MSNSFPSHPTVREARLLQMEVNDAARRMNQILGYNRVPILQQNVMGARQSSHRIRELDEEDGSGGRRDADNKDEYENVRERTDLSDTSSDNDDEGSRRRSFSPRRAHKERDQDQSQRHEFEEDKKSAPSISQRVTTALAHPVVRFAIAFVVILTALTMIRSAIVSRNARHLGPKPDTKPGRYIMLMGLAGAAATLYYI